MPKKTASLFKAKPAKPALAAPAPNPARDVRKPKRGKHLISGLFEEETYRQYIMLAAELGAQRQDLLREALNDVFIKHGKQPIA